MSENKLDKLMKYMKEKESDQENRNKYCLLDISIKLQNYTAIFYEVYSDPYPNKEIKNC